MDVESLKSALSLQDDEVDEDLGVALTSLVITAVHDKDPKCTLSAVLDAINHAGSARSLEPLTIIPIVVLSTRDGADNLMDLMARENSAKEVMMAAEESMERLHLWLQSGDDEDEEHSESQGRASAAQQLIRLIRSYAIAIPRLPTWKKSPANALRSRISELESTISSIGAEVTRDEALGIVEAVVQCGSALAEGSDDEAKAILVHVLEETTMTFANSFKASLAKAAFSTHFPRLIVPQLQPAGSEARSRDRVADVWHTLQVLGVTSKSCESSPSLSHFILLAHDRSYTFSLATITSFFPVILASIQLNVAFDETLSVLLSVFAKLRQDVPHFTLDTDLIAPLLDLLPHVASNHSESDIRHYAFRVISLILILSPSLVRLRALQELLSDKDLPIQMRVAAVGLLKEAVLEGLSAPDGNVFATPLLLTTFGPVVLRLDDAATLDLEGFMDSAEPLRLVECLGFYYVVLQRDLHNQTGVRDAESLRNVQLALLSPLRTHLERWKAGMASLLSNTGDHDAELQLGILGMWTDRVQGAIDAIAV
ncbi:uncharacterized protein BXZ73DRAFT_52793 [Epithele typhae]|uniref:uncharacterized protein n=1 Tax=Epithele typhae TaxID=378194 RepID=UPI0020083C23|nr:uncharacterized protein BXZ73DRAFT_52793 [Epithele typhae]KAH9918756.1 hypothetical protein BXZ73DRAFT_52793 [Epithele typhae]